VLTISVVVLTTTNVTYRPTATHLRHVVVAAAAAAVPSTSTTLIAAVASAERAVKWDRWGGR